MGEGADFRWGMDAVWMLGGDGYVRLSKVRQAYYYAIFFNLPLTKKVDLVHLTGRSDPNLKDIIGSKVTSQKQEKIFFLA